MSAVAKLYVPLDRRQVGRRGDAEDDHGEVGDEKRHEADGGCLGAILGGHAHQRHE